MEAMHHVEPCHSSLQETKIYVFSSHRFVYKKISLTKNKNQVLTWVGGFKTIAFPAISAGAIFETAKFTG